jgi:predicted nucleic acid-binding protein
VILVDTGPLVALADPRDGRHRDALADLKRLGPGHFRTCEAVLVEACFHLPYRTQRERLRAIVTELDIESLSTDDPDFRDGVFAWLLRYGEHEPDWADGCLAVLSEWEPRVKVWTYDREFRTTWRRPDGKPVPMAVKL